MREAVRVRRVVGVLVVCTAACSTAVANSGMPTADVETDQASVVGPTGADAIPPESSATSPARPVATTAPIATTTTDTTPADASGNTTTTAALEPRWPRTIRIAFTGDTLPHSPLWRQAARNAEDGGDIGGFDFRPMLAGLTPILDATDLAICHLETPIAPAGEEFTTNPFYGVPAEITDAIAAAGYDRCSTASNHAADRGTEGVDRTVDALEASGLGQSGMARTRSEIRPKVFAIDGIGISHLSYTFSFNGLSFPGDERWRSAVIDPVRILADARVARDLGADIVIVSMHWGAEGRHAPTHGQRTIADEITASGLIDIVVGHHAHVVQPIELVNDTWVLFGLGNILSNLPTTGDWPAASQDAAVVTAEFTVSGDGNVVVSRPVAFPTWVDKDAGWIVRDVDAELARTDISDGQRGRLERSRRRTETVLTEFLAN